MLQKRVENPHAAMHKRFGAMYPGFPEDVAVEIMMTENRA
jgi:hypothetical protein